MARGGMGELFLAAAGETGGFEKLCVVKKVLADLDDAGVHRRFLDEAKVVVRLNHSNLVQVFDAGRVEGEHYLAMELVSGKDLRALWNRCAQLHRRIPVDVAVYIVREVVRGLAYAHDALGLDLVHRDISPPNILVGYHGEVKLTDFGLAKSAIKREMTSPGVVFGRYSYLSPEQARGLPADRRTDVYAAAIVLWEMLTGRQLFPSSNRSHQDALAAVRNPQVRAPSQVVPGIPEGLDDVVLMGLAAEREQRYPGANEFRVALSDILARHFPTTDVDRLSEFMRDIFAREYKIETGDLEKVTRRDYSDIRAAADVSDSISISDVIPLSGESEIPLADGDIVELREPGDTEPGVAQLRLSAQDWVGQIVASRYRIESVLGIGGMGAVFRATHLALGKPVALKILHNAYSRRSDVVARFMREARAATQTGHPNIIDVVDIGTTDDGGAFYVMELLDGSTLAKYLSRDGTLAVRRAVHIVCQVCRALGAAHEIGIIHRDLKCENVFLVTRGRDPDFVKVLDFGVCKMSDGAGLETTPGMVIGSPAYLAPEVVAGAEASAASDIYAIGCILFELLTGHLPFEGPDPIEAMMRKRNTEAPSVRDLRPELPQELADVVARCLRRNPDARPASTRALEYDLRRASEGRPAAVAAVLGLSIAREEGPDASSSVSRGSLSREVAAEPMTALRSAMEASGERPAASLAAAMARHAASAAQSAAPAPPRHGSGVVAGMKALLFVALGGLLAGGVAMSVRPDLVEQLGIPGVGGAREPQPAATLAGERGLRPVTAASGPEAPAEAPQVPLPADTIPVAPDPAPAAAPMPPLGEPVPPAPAASAAPPANDPAALVARAELALAEGRWREPAVDSLALALATLALVDGRNEALLRLRTRAADQLLPLAREHLERKRWRDAVKVARDLASVWPEHREVHGLLVESLTQEVRFLHRRRAYAEALNLAQDLAGVAPTDADAQLLLARSAAKAESWPEAVAAYEIAVELRPKLGRTVRDELREARRRAR
jgi:serine/threonine protein kinase